MLHNKEDYLIFDESQGKMITLREAIDGVFGVMRWQNAVDDEGEEEIDDERFYEGEKEYLPISFWLDSDDMERESIGALILAWHNVGPGENSYIGNDDPDGPEDKYVVNYQRETHVFTKSENMGISSHERRPIKTDHVDPKQECTHCEKKTHYIVKNTELCAKCEQSIYEYVFESDASTCPFCGSDDIDTQGTSNVDPHTDDVRCENCGRNWEQHYTITGINGYQPEAKRHD